MGKLIDLTGKRFNRLLVLERSGSYIDSTGRKRPLWKCLCECGNVCVKKAKSLQSGDAKSCGCYNKELCAQRIKAFNKITDHSYVIKHNMSHTRLHNIWNNMKQRCYNPNNTGYYVYGAEGKTVCDEWLDKEKGFINFYNWSMSYGYRDDLTIDRIDGSKGYSPSNCRWVTMKEQSNNTRQNCLIEYKGKKQTIAQWAEEKGMVFNTLRTRLIRGWNIERALTEKPIIGKNQYTNKTP